MSSGLFFDFSDYNGGMTTTTTTPKKSTSVRSPDASWVEIAERESDHGFVDSSQVAHENIAVMYNSVVHQLGLPK